MNIYSEIITVPSSAIDIRNHVNNLAYLTWCVDAAGAHWVSRTTEKLRDNYVWYVLSHSINYIAAAFVGDELEIQTWVAKQEGAKSERHYKIIRLKDNKTLVEAKTVWCLVNGKTLRPTRITEEITTLFQ